MPDIVIVLHEQEYHQEETFHQTGFSQSDVQTLIKLLRILNKLSALKQKSIGISRKSVCILKVISIEDRKKSSQMLAQHLAESSGTKVNTSTRRGSLIKNGL